MAEMIVHRFENIATAEILDSLVAAVDTARIAAANSPSWLRAIDNAYGYLLQVESITYDVDAHAIRVESAGRPGNFYTANGDCQCRAFTHGAGICWHRACARLVRRALELQAVRPTAPAPAPRLRRCDDPTVSSADLVAELFA